MVGDIVGFINVYKHMYIFIKYDFSTSYFYTFADGISNIYVYVVISIRR